jgi:hypothetical protein
MRHLKLVVNDLRAEKSKLIQEHAKEKSDI